MQSQKVDLIGYIFVFSLLTLLAYAGVLSFKSIDFRVLEKLENQTLVLPTPIPTNGK